MLEFFFQLAHLLELAGVIQGIGPHGENQAEHRRDADENLHHAIGGKEPIGHVCAGWGDHKGQQDAESEVEGEGEPHAARGAGPLAAVSKGPQQEGQQHDNRQGYGSRKSDGAVGSGAEEGVGKLGFIHAGRCGLCHLLGL